MQKQQWVKVIGFFELIVGAMLSILFCLLLISVITSEDQRDGVSYVIFSLILLLPIILIIWAMGFTAYRNYESTMVLQFVGILVLVGIPLIILLL